MATTTKHTVHTDALETLGNIIGEGEKRDAIHLAVEPARAAHRLWAGMDVGPVDGGYGTCKNPVGIVDPFLKTDVAPGERFWLLVYPRQITSLRHVWSHPAFAEAEVYAEPQKTESMSESETWLREFHAGLQSDVSYEDLIATAANDARYGAGSGSLYFGDEICGEIPAEFWDHMEIRFNRKFSDRPTYFRCAC